MQALDFVRRLLELVIDIGVPKVAAILASGSKDTEDATRVRDLLGDHLPTDDVLQRIEADRRALHRNRP